MNLINNEEISDANEEVEIFYREVSKNVKFFRKKIKKSQLAFATDIGFNSVSFYCDCENNKNGKHFNLIHIVRISKYLNIDINELIKISNNK
ncbi:MAG: XRE family transcriptional regulator [Campylobacterota bacterium]|nr:XRE family transcriptional regulator [Campylobacterota bacterium]